MRQAGENLMQFKTCAHGNIDMTCPQCRGRVPTPRTGVGAASPAPVSGFGIPSTAHLSPAAQRAVPEDDSIETLFEQTKNANVRFEILLGSQLDNLVEKSERKVLSSSDREARQVKAYWSQVNAPTTVHEHEAQRLEGGVVPGNS